MPKSTIGAVSALWLRRGTRSRRLRERGLSNESEQMNPSDGPAVQDPDDIVAGPSASPSDIADAAEAPSDASGSSLGGVEQVSAPQSAENEEPEEAGSPAEPVMETGGLPDATPPTGLPRPRVPWWPFELYAIAWLALVGYAILGLSHETASDPAVLQTPYPAVLLGAVILTAAGPIVSIVSWLGAWLANGRRGPGLLTAALIRGALFTLFGVLAWWGALALVDAVRLGVIQ